MLRESRNESFGYLLSFGFLKTKTLRTPYTIPKARMRRTRLSRITGGMNSGKTYRKRAQSIVVSIGSNNGL